MPSLLAAIGEVIETHMIRTGFLQSEAARLPLTQATALQGDDGAGRRCDGRAPRSSQALPALLVA